MADRTWKRVRGIDGGVSLYLSGDGIRIFRVEEDYPHKDISWDVYSGDGDYPVGQYCTLRAAKKDIDKQFPEQLVANG